MLKRQRNYRRDDTDLIPTTQVWIKSLVFNSMDTSQLETLSLKTFLASPDDFRPIYMHPDNYRDDEEKTLQIWSIEREAVVQRMRSHKLITGCFINLYHYEEHCRTFNSLKNVIPANLLKRIGYENEYTKVPVRLLRLTSTSLDDYEHLENYKKALSLLIRHYCVDLYLVVISLITDYACEYETDVAPYQIRDNISSSTSRSRSRSPYPPRLVDDHRFP